MYHLMVVHTQNNTNHLYYYTKVKERKYNVLHRKQHSAIKQMIQMHEDFIDS